MQIQRLSMIAMTLASMLVLSVVAPVFAQSTPTAMETQPVMQATVDDVVIGLISWTISEDGRILDASIVLANQSSLPIALDPSVILTVVAPDGTTERVLLSAVSGISCTVGSGSRVEFPLRGELKAGVRPDRLIVGLIEQDRTGARAEFPFNGDGASAFGGSGQPGGNAGEGTPVTGENASTPASATPGRATPDGQQGACSV